MNNFVSFLVGLCAGTYFDKEIKEVVPILDKDAPTNEEP